MRKMKSGFAVAAAILAIVNVLFTIFSTASLLFTYSQYGISITAGVLAPNVISIVIFILLAVCCFRRKLGIFPGIVLGLIGLYALYGTVSNAILLASGLSVSPISTVLYLITNLLRAVCSVLLLVSCFTKGEKKFSFVPIGFVVEAVLGAAASAVSLLSTSGGFSNAGGAVLITLIFTVIFSIIGQLMYIFVALAINGSRADHVPPYGMYPQPQYQAPQYQVPQYQAPQYQQPQYQAPQYQVPQYQAPQYQAPQYQAPQPPVPQEQPQEQ